MRWIVKKLDSYKSTFRFVTQYNSTHPKSSRLTLTPYSVPTSRLRLHLQGNKIASHRPRTMIRAHFDNIKRPLGLLPQTLIWMIPYEHLRSSNVSAVRLAPRTHWLKHPPWKERTKKTGNVIESHNTGHGCRFHTRPDSLSQPLNYPSYASIQDPESIIPRSYITPCPGTQHDIVLCIMVPRARDSDVRLY